MHKTILILLSIASSIHLSLAGEVEIERYLKEIDDMAIKESKIELNIYDTKPDGRISKLMQKVDEIGQKALNEGASNDSAMHLSEKCLSFLSALRERRVYAYMLWAEGVLEYCTSSAHSDLSKLSQETLKSLYIRLSEIDISIISENMLNREVMYRLSEIYDCLNKENKKYIRGVAVKMQADPLSQNKISRKRKSLDDF